MNNNKSALKVPLSIAGLALLAIPFAYLLANVPSFHDDPGAILMVGLVALVFPGVLAYFFVFRKQPANVRQDPFLYIFTIFAFACILDLLIGLDLMGMTDVMTWYFSSGEPYLNTSHGMAINLWDGIVHLGLYLWLAFAFARGVSYRRAGLFWVGSMLASGMVFLMGNLIGIYAEHVEPSYLLNVPFMLVPAFLAWRIFNQPSSVDATKPTNQSTTWLLTLLLLAGAAFCFYRLLVVVNPEVSLTAQWASQEPYLASPQAYPKMQMLLYGFWLAPFLIIASLSLWRSPSVVVANWSWIMAGAVMQGQFAHLVASFSEKTEPLYRAGMESAGAMVLANLGLVVVVVIFALSYDRKVVVSGPVSTREPLGVQGGEQSDVGLTVPS